MPELPEVETVRLQLLSRLVGKEIAALEVFHPKTVDHNKELPRQLLGKAIAHIGRVGKLLVFSFVGEDDLFVLVHLKMTGQFFYFAEGDEMVGGGHSLDDKTLHDGVWPHKHTRLAITFTDTTVLYFNDMRLFGYFKVVTAAEKEAAVAAFGPEPHAPEFVFDDWFAKLHKRNTPVKAALLDQSLIAGLGNIYVDETLWRARVAPTRRACTLTQAEAETIRSEAGTVLKEAIAAGGTTFSTFKDVQGDAGSYVDALQVFGKQGRPCVRCGTVIEKIKVAGRGTHWCPGCQR